MPELNFFFKKWPLFRRLESYQANLTATIAIKEAELKSGQSSALEKLSELGNRFRNLSEQVLSHKNDSNEASNDLGGRMAELNSTLETISGFVRDLMLMAETSNGAEPVIGNSTVIEAA